MFLYVISLLIGGILSQQLRRILRFLIPPGQPQLRCSKKESRSLRALTTQMLVLGSHYVFSRGCQETSSPHCYSRKNGGRSYIFTCVST